MERSAPPQGGLIVQRAGICAALALAACSSGGGGEEGGGGGSQASSLDPKAEYTPAERALLVQYMDTRRLADGTGVPSLFTAGDREHLNERLRGVLYVLAQHPTFSLR